MKVQKDRNVFWNIWTSYATYYFGRANLSIVIPALLATHKNLNLYNIGLVSSGFFLSYTIGHFFHGLFSERHNPFLYISLGLIGSSIINLILGFSAGFFVVLFIGEIIDGFFQSMGWSSCVRANAITQKKDKRERTSILLGTSYQIGNSVAWLVSAFAVGSWGWRAGFWIAATLLFIRGILLLITKPKIEIAPTQKVRHQVKTILTFPILMSGLSFCFLNMIRYGIIVWIPLYLFQTQNMVIEQMGELGLKVCLIPIAGVFGTLIYNVLKFRRDVVTVVFLLFLAFSFVVLPFTKGMLSIFVLLVGSFFLYGPHVFLSATLPTRYFDKQVVAASSGFIAGMGYVGTVFVGLIIPILVSSANGSWKNVFIFWAILSFTVVAIMITFVWKYELKKA
jgi:sugar phosphate permease